MKQVIMDYHRLGRILDYPRLNKIKHIHIFGDVDMLKKDVDMFILIT